MSKSLKKAIPESNHVIMLIHGPEERLEVYMNHTRAPESLVKITGAFQKYFPQWKAKQGPGVLRYKCPHFGLDDEVRLLDMAEEQGFELLTTTSNNHQTKLVFKRSFQLHQDLPVLYGSIIGGSSDHDIEH